MMAKHCTRDCPVGETECCICCDKVNCGWKCDDMDSYEFAEDCPEYLEEQDGEINENVQ